MKKLDYLTIIIVFMIGILIFGIYFYKTNLNSENIDIVVNYQNKEIDRFKYDDNLNYRVVVDAIDGKLSYKLYSLNDKEEQTKLISEKSLPLKSTKHTYNSVNLIYGDVHMHEADCENKFCYRMKISGPISTSIICTNGLTVMLKGSEFGGVIV